MTPATEVDISGLEWTARFVGWGRGRYHVQEKGATHTACGREIPEGELRGAVFSPLACARCKASELYDAAEDYRQRVWDAAQAVRDEGLERNRAGVFRVYRCRKCGAQHRGHDPHRPGVPYCMDAHHEADLEEVEAIGPPLEVDASSETAA